MSLVAPSAAHGYALGIDVGGTFTDVVLAGPFGQEAVAKTLSTHNDPTEGIRTGVRRALDVAGVRPDQVTRFVHATTLATNAILENKGERVAHIGTAGFRSLLPLGRYARVEEDRFDTFFDPPAAPIPAEDCFEVVERMDSAGQVVVALDESSVRDVAERIRLRGIESVAITLLHSYANRRHEDRVGEIVREVLGPDATVVTSAEIWPEVREYERTTTTLMSAYIGPVMVKYLRNLERRLADMGVQARVQVMESGGGVMSADLAGRRAVATIESGPAAGVLAARAAGLAAGRSDVISFDMGGTTAKASVIRNGIAAITTEFHVGGKGSFGGRRAGTGVPIKTPAIDLAEVGAGGGSIAWVDHGGALRVGPNSAGSEPGPACYGNGGSDPTVTDANVVLGYLDPIGFAGGSLELRPDLSAKAIEEKVAGPMGVDLSAAANAIHQIANAAMASAVQVVTVQRGLDPRGFAVVAFGGAGPMHAARVAEPFGIDTVIVPPSCGVGSAVGLLGTDLSTDRVMTRICHEKDLAAADVDAAFAELAAAGTVDLGVDIDGPSTRIEKSLDVRLAGQAHELTIRLSDDADSWNDASLEKLRVGFAEKYQEAYGIDGTGPIEVVSFRVRVTNLVEKVPLGQRATATAAHGPSRKRAVWFQEFGEYRETPVYERDGLIGGTSVSGPLVVADSESTIVVPPTWSARVDDEFNVILTRTAQEAK
ncbi:hydantoinase/oxoprolinase family protein [Gordonia rubripertincta]|uniref:Hydantoinase/oxoprolinase family protein n=1 Tax=Gordonia rubripertincta TaxID=36822 RepID=A0ABT4MNQ2_GORRU|nr:hydantoinase/oxoprolinase family protein [Gordonia rubripertincta]MCZ4548623.1 hydantoinase/oxoprolinase family protein [Gordonia rubripertincta]